MLCQRCQDEPATIHMTRIQDGRQQERHLCERCARETGEADFMLEPTFSIHHLVAGLMGSRTRRQPTVQRTRRCRLCGLSLQEFSQTGRLGCPECYETFDGALKQLMRQIHGDVQHRGKMPAGGDVTLSCEQQFLRLREQLEEAVAAEEYERAARLRDEIRQLEGQHSGGEGQEV